MLKVIALVDKENTALDRLAKGVAKYHTNLDYKVIAVHPKRPDPEQLQKFEQEAFDADIIDAQYYRTLYKLRDLYPSIKDKKTILTHNNPYAITEQDWNDVDLNVGNNNYITKELGKITEKPVEYIPLTVNTDFWEFNPDWQPSRNVLMVANRIESKKGILEVAKACNELNLHFILVGAISDPNYFGEILRTGNVEFHDRISDEELRKIYYKSGLHICNSKDNFESGTLPVLESMLCGTPVLTREVGHVPDLYNGENMFVYKGNYDDVKNLQEAIFKVISDKKRQEDYRQKAWQTAKSRSFERRAYAYQKLYRQVVYPDQESVSIIVPVYDKPDIIRKCLEAIAEQTHKNIEVIVADDSLQGESYSLILDYAKYVNFPVRYINTAEVVVGTADYVKDYGLARGRNEATIEATGDVIVYCDQRMIMENNAVEEFLKFLGPKIWLYGNKGAKKEFVENFSCIRREDVINFGLFNERIYAYGGLSQETRNRFRYQGGRTEYAESAKATPTGKSSNRNRKREDIIKMKNRLWKMGLE